MIITTFPGIEQLRLPKEKLLRSDSSTMIAQAASLLSRAVIWPKRINNGGGSGAVARRLAAAAEDDHPR